MASALTIVGFSVGGAAAWLNTAPNARNKEVGITPATITRESPVALSREETIAATVSVRREQAPAPAAAPSRPNLSEPSQPVAEPTPTDRPESRADAESDPIDEETVTEPKVATTTQTANRAASTQEILLSESSDSTATAEKSLTAPALGFEPGTDPTADVDSGAARGAAEPKNTINAIEVATLSSALEGESASAIDDGATLVDAMSKPQPVESKALRREIQPGETLIALLESEGASYGDAYAAARAIGKEHDVRKLRAGQLIEVDLTPSKQEISSSPYELDRVAIKLDAANRVVAGRTATGEFRAAMVAEPLIKETVSRAGTINSSLYVDAVATGVDPSAIFQFIRRFSFAVDFQREIQPGDAFEIVYEAERNEDGDTVRHGDVLFASLTLRGKRMDLYRFQVPSDGFVDYFDSTGRSSKRLLMRTPVDGARLSSRFGSRRHPVLGYTKMHRGIDYAAPRGTPIMAAGTGVVERANRFGSYGNYVRIRHNGTYKTAYAHLKGFAKGIKAGAKVRQGDIIGFIGSTGRSTGPHLHYEVMREGKQVNPLSLDLPQSRRLDGADLKSFKAEKARIDALRGPALPEAAIAQAN